MPHRSEPTLVVLHVLRLKGIAEVAAVACATSLGDAEVSSAVAALAEDGLVSRRDGRLSGWTLTDDGRVAHATGIAAELEASGQRERIDAAYRSFLAANGGMLGACTAWQLRGAPGEQVLNDHTDPTWDAAVLARLVELHGGLQPVLGGLDGTLERFDGYRPRFDTALECVLAGHHEWFTKPGIDSYHQTWFELHEDLLCTLGTDRAAEARHLLEGRR